MLEPLFELPFLRGLVVGLLMAAPIGAVGAMCIKRALSDGWPRAMSVGLGSACVDALFGAIAGMGLTFIATFVVDHQTAIGVLGGLIVIGLGVATYIAPIKTAEAKGTSGHKRRDFAAAFMMSIANPATFIGAIGLFAAFGQAGADKNAESALVLVVGVFCGSMLWWTFLTVTARLMRHRFVPETLSRLNKIEGAVITIFGLVLVAVVLSQALTK